MTEQTPPTPDAHSSERDIQTFASGAGLIFFGKVFGAGVQYVYSITIARVLGAELLGIYMLGFTLISLADVVSRLGLDSAATRFVALYHGEGDTNEVRTVIRRVLAYTCVTSAVVLVLLLLFADFLAARVFRQPALASIVEMLALSLPLMVMLAVALAITQGLQQMRYTVYVQNLALPLTNIALVGLGYWLGYTLQGVVFAWLAASLLSAMLALVFLWRVSPQTTPVAVGMPRATPRTTPTELLRFAAPILLIAMLTTMIIWSDILMLGYFRPANEVGVYSVAARTAMLTSLILVSFNTVISPMIADLYNRKMSARLAALFKFSTRWIYTFTLGFFLFLLLFRFDILALFGPEFLTGSAVLAIVAFTYFLNAATGPVGLMLIMTGNQSIMLVNSVVVFCLNITANYFLIPQYGAIGAAVASSISIVAYNIVMLIEVYVVVKMHPYDRNYVRPTLVGCALFGLFYLALSGIPWSPLVRLLMVSPLFGLAFLGIVIKTCTSADDVALLEQIKARKSGNGAH